MGNAFQPPTPFGAWLQEVRHRDELTLQQIADRSGVRTGTLSRIERDQVQVTLMNALRICDALDVTPDVLYESLGMLNISPSPTHSDEMKFIQSAHPQSDSSQNAPPQQRSSFINAHHKRLRRLRDQTPETTIMTMQDVRDFLQLTTTEPEHSNSLLAKMLNLLVEATQLQDNVIPFDSDDAVRLLTPLPFYRCDVPYPAPTIDQLMQIYAAGGVIIMEDARHFARQALDELEHRVAPIPADLRYPLARLRMSLWERTPLDRLLEVDSHLNQKGLLLEQYWFVHQMQEAAIWQRKDYRRLEQQVTPRMKIEVHPVYLFVKLYRWLYVSGETDASWMRQSFLQS